MSYNSHSKYNIKPFDLNKLNHPTCIYTNIYGNDAFCWFLNVITKCKAFQPIVKVAMARNPLNQNTYLNITDNKFIYSSYEPAFAERVEKRHKLICKNNKKFNRKTNSSVLLFIDQCMIHNKYVESLYELFTNQKSNNLSICWSLTETKKIAKLVPHTDYAIIGSLIHNVEKKKYYKLFGNFIQNIRIFNEILLENTRYDKFIVINLKSPSTTINEKIFYLDLSDYLRKNKSVPL